jgi:hypothetical protein
MSGPGWFRERYRHSLAARGVKTSFYARKHRFFAIDEIRLEKPSVFERAVGLKRARAVDEKINRQLANAVLGEDLSGVDTLAFVRTSEPNVMYIGKNFKEIEGDKFTGPYEKILTHEDFSKRLSEIYAETPLTYEGFKERDAKLDALSRERDKSIDKEVYDDPGTYFGDLIGHEQMHDLLADMTAKSEVPIGTSNQFHNLNDDVLFHPDSDYYRGVNVIKSKDVHSEPLIDDLGVEPLKTRAKILAERGETVPGLNAPVDENI